MTRRRSQAGFTLLEMMIVLVLIAGLLTMLSSLTQSANESQKFANELMEALEADHDILNSVNGSLTSAVLLLTNSANGNAYNELLDKSEYPQPIASRLPTPRTDGTFAKEKDGEQLSGNQLVFAEQYRSDAFVCESTRKYRVPIIRIHAYYLSAVADGPVPGTAHGLNLCHWVSEPLADAAVIDRIDDADDRKEVLKHLFEATADADGGTHRPVTVVWKIGGDPADPTTLRSIKGAGSLDNDPPDERGPSWKIVPRTRPPARDLLAYRNLSVATVHAPPHFGVSSFSKPDLSGAGFPHGFEVQISGPVTARMILVRLVVVKAVARDKVGFSRFHVVAYTAQGQTI